MLSEETQKLLNDSINEAIGLSGFFLVFTAIPIGAGLIMLLISPFLKKRMHGIH